MGKFFKKRYIGMSLSDFLSEKEQEEKKKKNLEKKDKSFAQDPNVEKGDKGISLKDILSKRGQSKYVSEKTHYYIGKITSAFGIKGEVKVIPKSDIFEKQIAEILEKEEKLTFYRGKDKISLTPIDIKPHKSGYIFKFKEINDRNEAEDLRNYELWIEKEKASKLDKNEYYVDELIGFKCIDEKKGEIGTLKDIMFQPSADVLVIETKDKKEILVPFIKEFVKDVDKQNKTIYLSLIDGFLS